MKRRMLFSVALLGLLIGMAGTAQAAPAPAVTFHASDAPGSWFECVTGSPGSGSLGCTPGNTPIGNGSYLIDEHSKQKSLAVIKTGETIAFTSDGQAKTLHTAVSLIYPKDASFLTSKGLKSSFDTDLEPNSNSPFSVTLGTPGLYVFFCDIHPYMFAGVIVADIPTDVLSNGVNLGGQDGQLTLENVVAPTLNIPSASDLALRLLRTFFIATDTNNWQKFSTTATSWSPKYPQVFVNVRTGADGIPANTTLNAVPLASALTGYFHEPKTLTAPSMPGSAKGVGQVWVDTQFEKTAKLKPGTATAVNATTWVVERKVGLDTMNNPHNMWTNRDQTLIYQTNWFDNTLTVFNRTNGALVRNITVGPAPAHVMTRISDDFVHVSLNGGNDIVELKPGANLPSTNIPMSTVRGESTHPHAHWMGQTVAGDVMVTPNPDTEDSTLYDFFPYNAIGSRTPVGHFPIATGMTPDSKKYYVANFLDSSINVIDIHATSGSMPTAALSATTPKIDLLGLGSPLNTGCYNPTAIDLDPTGDGVWGVLAPVTIPGIANCPGGIGALPIQTPVSPDGRFMLTANTLTANILVTDTKTDKVVASLACDAGCHGVAFGAKKNGGYYAYVSSKFSNRMIVVDPDPNGATLPNDGSNAVIVGSVLLTNGTATDFAGMGGQGVLPIPLVYNGWVQNLPEEWKDKLTNQQINPIGQ